MDEISALLTALLRGFSSAKLVFPPAITAGSKQVCLLDPNKAPNPAPSNVDLVLGPNEEFRDAILKASSALELDPAALAALIDAEAAKDKSGKWKADSLNKDSGAAGLTQFLASTWKDEAKKDGTSVNATAKIAGVVDEQNQIIKGKEAELLALRYDPGLSIMAAAEYGKRNLSQLRNAKLIAPGTSDDVLARLMYLAHHEGAAGAKAFLSGNLSEERAAKLLKSQVGGVKAEEMQKASLTAKAAYEDWLNGYMDKKIVPDRFRAPKPKAPRIPLNLR